MKKVLLSVFALGMLSLASCKKDYTCTCTTTGGVSGSGSITIHGTKKDAKAACDAYDSSSSIGGTTYTTACEID